MMFVYVVTWALVQLTMLTVDPQVDEYGRIDSTVVVQAKYTRTVSHYRREFSKRVDAKSFIENAPVRDTNTTITPGGPGWVEGLKLDSIPAAIAGSRKQ
ncbi:MAG: hypothetical protein KJN62_03830 [Deltaproteobacteria bacterium]|nr:hypothetical protein [Deltaproteobacteria bacterium]